MPGQLVAVSLSGFGANEPVLVRWLVGSKWTPVGTIATDGSGNASAQVVVPSSASSGANKVRGDGDTKAAQTGAVTVAVPGPATASLSSSRGTVNSTVSFSLSNFSPNATVTVTWRRPGGSSQVIGSATVTNAGTGAGTVAVPATTGGINTVSFSDGVKSATTQFEVVPRIKVIPGVVSPGETIDVSLRGYAKGESVRIRWLINGKWVTVAVATTSNTGSANIEVTVPDRAASGPNSVRGDGTVNRQQTNAVLVVP
jgi:hypothetical protein